MPDIRSLGAFSGNYILGAVMATLVPTCFLCMILGLALSNVSFVTVGLPALGFLVIHPLIGRVVSFLGMLLGDRLDDVLAADTDLTFGSWSPNGALIFGALWPITIAWVVCLALGLFLGALYRSIW